MTSNLFYYCQIFHAHFFTIFMAIQPFDIIFMPITFYGCRLVHCTKLSSFSVKFSLLVSA